MTGQVNFHVLEKIVQTSDGGYILAGIADKDFSLTTNFNLHIIRLDNTGSLLWWKTTTVLGDRIMDMKLSSGNQLTILTNQNYLIRYTVIGPLPTPSFPPYFSDLTLNFSQQLVNPVSQTFSVHLYDFEIDGNNYVFLGDIDMGNGNVPFALKTNGSFVYSIGVNPSIIIDDAIIPSVIYKSKVDNYFYIGGSKAIYSSTPSYPDNLLLIKTTNDLM